MPASKPFIRDDNSGYLVMDDGDGPAVPLSECQRSQLINAIGNTDDPAILAPLAESGSPNQVRKAARARLAELSPPDPEPDPEPDPVPDEPEDLTVLLVYDYQVNGVTHKAGGLYTADTPAHRDALVSKGWAKLPGTEV